MGLSTLVIAVIPIAVIIIIVLIIVNAINASNSNTTYIPQTPHIYESPEKRAGRMGEQKAALLIKRILQDGDHMFRNVNLKYDDSPIELDIAIVNKYGVFIIEVKDYNGEITGGENDFEWTKYNTTDAGNTYSKKVKNPIKQVKRQVYVLANYLKDNTVIRVWVEGYVLLLQDNSPVESKCVLHGINDIDRAIHTPGRNRLTKKDIDDIAKLLSGYGSIYS